MIDPSSVMTAAARRAQSTIPTKTRSEATISYRPPELVPDNASDDFDSDDEAASQPLTMSPAEIRVIRRLSARSNVLPVIGRADSLTDEMLSAIKDAVRTGLRDAGLGFGVFDTADKGDAQKKRDALKKPRVEFIDERDETPEGKGNGRAVDGSVDEEGDTDEDASDDEERPSRPVIKLRPSRHRDPRLSRSQSRRDIMDSGSPDTTDRESVANVRFSAHLIAKTNLNSLLPFALIAPGDVGRLRKRAESSIVSPSVQDPSEDEHHTESIGHTTAAHSPGPPSVRNFTYLQGPPDDLKGVFTRKFRWGTVDVLDPNHCDFAALRTAVLSTHLKILKTHTKEVLYEKYRTEKLLARRATRNISDAERQRLLEDLGL
jgi:hypothetical protein